MKKIISTIIILVIAFVFDTGMVFAATNTTVSAPASVKAASAGYESAKVSWGVVSGADGYQIYRATSETGTYSNIKTTTSASYTNTGLTTGKTYYYKVKAFRYSGTTKVYGKYSSIVSAKPIPSAPTNSKAVSTNYNSVKLSWNSVSGASAYRVYRATSSTGIYSYVKATTKTSYTDTGLTTGKTYYYKVRAYKTIGTTKVYGKYTTMASVKPLPSTPTNFIGTPVSNTSTKVSWGTVSGATGYQVYRATSSSGSYSCIKTTTSTSFTNTELTSGRTYYYKVRAYRTVGTSKVYSNFTTVVAVVTDEFNASIASKKISGAFTDTGNGVIAILSNDNSYSISLSATMVFYDEAGSMLGESSGENYYFEPGKKCAVYFSGPYDGDYNNVEYSSFKTIYSVDSTEYLISNLSDIKIVSNIGSDNVMVEITNSGNETSEYTEIGIIFYKDGEAIAYDYNYAECETPGSIDYLEFSFPYDENYDTIQIDSYEVYVNSSYKFTW